MSRDSPRSKMKDLLAKLEKLRADAAECRLIRDLATDSAKRELFGRLAEQLGTLATAVESTIANGGGDAFLGHESR
jgi:hypothetical protein